MVRRSGLLGRLIRFVCCRGPHTYFKQARRDSNPHHPDLESGALPFELLAYNFKIPELPQLIHLPVLRTFGTNYKLSRLPVKLVLTTEAAVFFELESLRGTPLIFRCRVIAASAFDTRQSDQIPHGYSLHGLSCISKTARRLLTRTTAKIKRKVTPGYHLRHLLLPSGHPPGSQSVTLFPGLSA